MNNNIERRHSLIELFLVAALLSACQGEDAGKTTPTNLAAGPAPVTAARITAADMEPGNWLSHGRSYDEQRFSPLSAIDENNVGELGLAWHFDIDTKRALEATPLVADGVMYLSAAWSVVYALDARSGKLLWKYDPEVPRSWGTYACCDVVNRGVALWNNKVYVATIDGYLVALDARSGELAWKADTIDRTPPYTITGAPRVIKGKVIIGNGGAEYGVRGYVSAYDAETGKQLWRTYTVPGNPADGFESEAMEMAAATWKGEWWKFGGGGTAWDAFAYDPNLDLLYVGVGNGAPWNREIRSPGGGDNLFLASVLALNPDTGEYRWHYQTTPGETWDYTATQHMVLADLDIEGQRRKVLMQAPKNGFFYVIDRETGQLISAQPYVPVNWASHIDLETGRPVEAPGARYEKKPSVIFPSSWGGHNWHPMSYSPRTGLVYIPAIGGAEVFANPAQFSFTAGQLNTGLDNHMATGAAAAEIAGQPIITARVSAWDPIAQREVFRIEGSDGWNAGVLSTAGNLLFQGAANGEFAAFRASDGKPLWAAHAGTGIQAAPISYTVDGEQYVSVLGSWGVYMGIFAGDPAPDPKLDVLGRVLTYKLGAAGQLPPARALTLTAPELPEQDASAEVISHGKALFYGRCSWCHGTDAVGTGSIPDLRYASPATHQNWQSIVRGGAYREKGMPAFADVLSDSDARAIQAFVIDEAERAFE